MADAEAWAVAIEGDLPPLLVEHPVEYGVVVEPPVDVLVVTLGDQGPPGPPGEQGPAGPAWTPEAGPAFTYTDGRVTRIDYDSGAYKTFTYTAGVLTQLDYVKGGVITRKAFAYNPDGTLGSITQTVL